MSSLDIHLLKQFNNLFISYVNQMIQFAPPNGPKEIKILPAAIDFIINRGDPTKIILIFYNNIHIYSDRIYKEDRTLLEEGFIIGQLSKALDRNKDKLDNDKINMLTNKFNTEQDNIKNHIGYARQYWDSKDDTFQKNIWKNSQILLKLSERYAKLTGNDCNDDKCACRCVN